MRISLNLPDETIERIRNHAGMEGVSQAEWLRRVIIEACTPALHSREPGGAPLGDEERTGMEEAIRTVEETVSTLTAERDTLAARVVELEQLSRVAAAEVAAIITESDREHEEHDRLEDDRTRARTRAAAAAAERDQARRDLAAMTDRAIAAESRAAVAEAVAAERLARIGDLLAMSGAATSDAPGASLSPADHENRTA